MWHKKYSENKRVSTKKLPLTGEVKQSPNRPLCEVTKIIQQ